MSPPLEGHRACRRPARAAPTARQLHTCTESHRPTLSPPVVPITSSCRQVHERGVGETQARGALEPAPSRAARAH